MRLAVFAALLAPSASAFAWPVTPPARSQSGPFTYVSGNVRVEVLSPTLLRIEQKGPEGWEDRPTFNVVGRTGWSAVKPDIQKANNQTGLNMRSWHVVIPRDAQRVEDVQITDPGGREIFRYDGKAVNSKWLPEPGHVPAAWSISDTPRMVPGRAGLTPEGADPNSGWDLGNDAPDVYVFLPGGSYNALRSDFLKLTGPIEMPPLYALGYTDSKYYAYYQDEALKRIDEYRSRQIPLDTFVVDTDWRIGGSHGYSVDTKFFPDMPSFLQKAHEKHAHIMFNDHPEPQAKAALDPKELEYRLEGLGGLLKEGVDIWWYDRNWGVSLVNPAPNLRHEVWGMKLYHDVTQRVFPDRRPLTMSNVDGIDNGFRSRPPEIVTHRYPVQWTGDTRSQWEFLRRGVENAVFEGVLGLNAWVNEDLGGHVGKPAPDLYIRYLEFGSLCPFMRVHCTKGQTREPWAFGPEAERIVPEYIKMRYRLMPLFYASARAAYESGDPILRRLDLQYPAYKEATQNDQYLIGDSLLVAPVVGGVDAAVVPASAFPESLNAEYFDNKDLQGDPVVTRHEQSLNLDWGNGSPDQKVPDDNFSARFTGKVIIPKDHSYRLSITADDGCKLWIDGKLWVDKWLPQDSVTSEAPVDLQPGSTHDIKVEYMEVTGGALLKLRWQPTTVRSEEAQRTCWIPPGTWLDIWTGARHIGPATIRMSVPIGQIPMFLREGAVLPLAPEVQWTGQKDWSSMTLEVLPGDGAFTLYEDDGRSPRYQQGDFRRTPITVRRNAGVTTLRIAKASGSFAGAPQMRKWTVRLVAPRAGTITVDGKPVRSRTVPRAARQPFQNLGGEPIGNLIEITIPISSVARAHTVVFRTGKR